MMEFDLSKHRVNGALRQFAGRAGNLLPILVSCLIYESVTQSGMFAWIRYDAVIVPFCLLAFNFALDCRAFSLGKLLLCLVVEASCVLVHLLYFEFNLDPAMMGVMKSMAGIAAAIIIIGGLALWIFSRQLRRYPRGEAILYLPQATSPEA